MLPQFTPAWFGVTAYNFIMFLWMAVAFVSFVLLHWNSAFKEEQQNEREEKEPVEEDEASPLNVRFRVTAFALSIIEHVRDRLENVVLYS